jgi:hypothetical protein
MKEVTAYKICFKPVYTLKKNSLIFSLFHRYLNGETNNPFSLATKQIYNRARDRSACLFLSILKAEAGPRV